MKSIPFVLAALVAGNLAAEDICCLDTAESFAISAENPTGARGGGNAERCRKVRASICIRPGETVAIADVAGEGRIETIWFGGSISSDLVLRMYWDGSKDPAVEAPLPAFFGWAYDDAFVTAEGKYPCLNSAMILLSPAVGCNCFFPMPFRKGARITVENRGKAERRHYYMITGSRGPQPKNAGYFHAAYHEARPVAKGVPYVILDSVAGRGRFVGVTLAAGQNGGKKGACCVEGEIRMFLDGEKTPSIHYTGTEDYFGGSYAYGFGNPALARYQEFSGLYLGMFAVFGRHLGTGRYQQRFLQYRFHVKDPIRFTKGFRMTMDNLDFPNQPRQDDFMSVAYWYEEEK